MAAVAQPLSPAARQPFGVVGANRLRVLESMKNHQNGVTAPSKKRPLESDSSDTENVDPALIDNGAKRKRADLDTKLSKPVTYTPTTFKTTVQKPTTNNPRLQTPLSRPRNISIIPHSALLRAPAGRSPKSKSGTKAFARRSIGSTYSRIDPPSFTNSNRHAPKAPFSIATALNGTFNVSNFNVKPQTKPSKPASRPKAWDFEIYADTEQDEMANLMEHSTCVLDISDDEEKAASRDDRGKENIPPPDFSGLMNGNIMSSSAAQAQSSSRTVEMTDEPRSALGELDVARFIPEGKDAMEPVLVIEDGDSQEEQAPEHEVNISTVTQDPAVPLTTGADEKRSYQQHQPTLLSHEAVSSLIQNSAPASEAVDKLNNAENVADEASSPTVAEMEIWESESAAEEAAAATASSNE